MNNVLNKVFCHVKSSRLFLATNTKNNKRYIANCQEHFARNHGLQSCHISLCLYGKQKSHKGWIFSFL